MPEELITGLLEGDVGSLTFKALFKTLFMKQASALQSTQLSTKSNIGKQRDVEDIFCAMPQDCDKM